MIVLPGNACFPPSTNLTSDVDSSCCQITYVYNQTVGIPSNTCFGRSENYYPNRCTLNPRTALATIGPMVFPCTIDWFILVDDEAIVNGLPWQPGEHLVTLGGGTNAADCSTFPGGTSLCNGAHYSEGSSTRLAGQTFSFQVGDNHGIQCYGNGFLELYIAEAP